MLHPIDAWCWFSLRPLRLCALCAERGFGCVFPDIFVANSRRENSVTEALQIISNEHRSMWQLTVVLDELRKQLGNPRQKPDSDLFNLILDYIEQYVERVHEPKEEAFLYKAVMERTSEGNEMIAEFQREHASTPEVVARLRSQLKSLVRDYPAGVAEFQAALEEYISMMRRHILREESDLFPLARKILTDRDWDGINTAFADSEDPLFGERVRAEFRSLMSRIVNQAPEPIGFGLVAKAKPAAEAHPVLLSVANLTSQYGRIQALRGVTIEVRQGQLVALVGANGAGKTTLLRAISGVQKASAGEVRFAGQDITHLRPDQRVRMGICQVPEGRQVFGPLSVEDNLRLGAYTRGDKKSIEEDLEQMYAMFPILKQKFKQAAGTLSGGQQQMLAMARALMGRPKLLLLDEPSMGLAPLLIQEIFNAIISLREQGKTVFLVEQNAQAALSIADQAYVIETGEIVLSGSGSELLDNEQVRSAYLGI
ncbi:MAG: ATP-binding cassette domain-containing protein [Sulfuritalea sp.]|nr:ATP-binding cassette domain-containing protein [Sulfuritalea sp.]